LKTSNKTFWELISGDYPASLPPNQRDEEFIIDIPIIQRDYAQGRQNEEQRRNLFLQKLFDHLSKTEPLHLDFIYGRTKNERHDDKLVFSPIDGQQRLTTLYLLHWYIGLKEKIKENQRDSFLKLQNFIYDTRLSSRDFCKLLIKKEITLPCNKEQSIEFVITSSYWFRDSWKNDPTIKAMLIMLQAIHTLFFHTDGIWSKLTKRRIITFHILDMSEKGFELNDELYIKMNARGKQLTDFENFKANLLKWMEDDVKFDSVEVDNRCKEQYYFTISQKIDNDWTKFLWQIAKNSNVNKEGTSEHLDGKMVDLLFIRLIYRYFFQKYILLSSITNKEIDKNPEYKFFYNEEEFQDFKVFENILSNNLIHDFETIFDKLIDYWQDIENAIIPSWYDGKNWTFLNKDITQKDRVVFLAISLFLEQKREFDNNEFKQWIRVVWNIVENTDIDSAASMIGAMKLIYELSKNAYKIYAFLANKGEKIESDSSKIAIEEERTKCSFIINNSYWEEEFVSAEKHSFFKGAIRFIITDNMGIEEFRHRKEMAFKVFDEKGINDEYQKDGHLFLRALISRYTDSKIIDNYFTDTDDKEHHLKKMLASDKVIREALQEWLSLNNEKELKNALNQSVRNSSKIPGWDKNDNQEKTRIRRAHEALYKVPELQNWMQETGCIRFHKRGGWHLYISKMYNIWIMLDSCRNEVIEYLLRKEFGTDSQAGEPDKKIPYFKGYDVEVFGLVNGNELKLTFDSERTLKVEKKKANEEWEVFKSYDYVELDTKLIEILKKDIFT
jgi:hypothetical protein